MMNTLICTFSPSFVNAFTVQVKGFISKSCVFPCGPGLAAYLESCYLGTCQRLYSKNCFAYNSWNRDSVRLDTLGMADVSLDSKELTLRCPPVSLTVIRLTAQET